YAHRQQFNMRCFELKHFTKLELGLIAGNKLWPLTGREAYPPAHMLSFEPGQIFRSKCLRGTIEYVSSRRASLHSRRRGLDAGLNRAVRIFLLRRWLAEHSRAPDARTVALVRAADIETHEVPGAQRNVPS